MRYPVFFGLLVLVIVWSSCRSDFDPVPSTGNLEFSRDTVFLDTIFTNIGSATYNLKVYNRTDQDLVVPRIGLARGEGSHYRLNVDGLPGKSFEDIEILAGDSIFIFIETTLEIRDLSEDQNQFLYTDMLEFGNNLHMQEVPLVTLVRDAVFLYPKKFADGSTETLYFETGEAGDELLLQAFFLNDNDLHLTSEKPYVIYNYAAVPPGKTLQIDAGARIHFHSNSGIIVSRNASLQVKGEYSENRQLMEKEVVFEGDRLESGYSNIPGQWGSIWLTKGSKNNSLSYTTIKNASIGLWIDGSPGAASPPALLSNVQIYNSAVNGLLSRTGNIEAENVVINNSGQASMHLALGGNYSFKHSTFANYWGQGFRNYPAVYIENEWETTAQVLVSDLEKAYFSNCIIYGNQNLEILFNRNKAAAFNIQFQNSLLRFRDPEDRFGEQALYDFNNINLYQDIILNQDPLFTSPRANDLELTEGSPAINAGDLKTAREVPFDLVRRNRTGNPDMGAYEWIPLTTNQK